MKLHFRNTRTSKKPNNSKIAPTKSWAWLNVLEKGFLFMSDLHIFENINNVNNANIPK